MPDNDYDAAVDKWRKATREVLSVGSDKPEATADDLTEMLVSMIEEEGE